MRRRRLTVTTVMRSEEAANYGAIVKWRYQAVTEALYLAIVMTTVLSEASSCRSRD